MKFNIKKYSKGKYVMHCKTEQEAKSFCDYLHTHGRTWNSGDSYKSKTEWEIYKSDTVYYFMSDMFGTTNSAMDYNYTVLEWSDFMNNTFTKADLKTGDIVKFRSGKVGIVGMEHIIMLCAGYQPLYCYNDDLTYVSYSPNDIVAVRRPTKSFVEFDTFDNCQCTLIYEREEVEEMTLAEVCKLLGKNIKIIQ